MNSAVKQKENLQVGDDMKGRSFDIFNIAVTAVLILAGVLDVVKGLEIFDYVYFAVILVVAVYTIWRIVKEKSKKWYQILFVFLLIFVTGLEEPRAQAYKDLHCFGYIQKPYDVDEIHRIVKKCLTYKPVNEKSKLHLKKDGIHIFFDTDQIVYVRIRGKDLFVKVYGRPIDQYAYLTMKEIMEQLKSEPMVTCGKGLLVNGKYMDQLDQKERRLYLKDDAEPLKLTRAGLKENIHSITDSLSQ